MCVVVGGGLKKKRAVFLARILRFKMN